MTKQEMFDKVWDHFVVNAQPSSVDGTRCRYRGPNGSKCAFGLLIPDELYKEDMEGRTVQGLFTDYDFDQGFLEEIKPHKEFIQRLQICHDKSAIVGLAKIRKLSSDQQFRLGIQAMMRELALRYSDEIKMPELVVVGPSVWD